MCGVASGRPGLINCTVAAATPVEIEAGEAGEGPGCIAGCPPYVDSVAESAHVCGCVEEVPVLAGSGYSIGGTL